MNNDIKVLELCAWVRRNRVKITDISYGSGGYSVSMMDLRTGKTFTSYSWDAIDAINKAQKELENAEEIDSSEDITDPGHKLRLK